jgi:hypothetical protein
MTRELGKTEFIEKLKHQPILSKWKTDNSKAPFGVLNAHPSGRLMLSIKSSRISLKENDRYLQSNHFVGECNLYDQVVLGWLNDNAPKFGFWEGLITYPHYVVAGSTFFEDGKFNFNTVTYSFEFNLWGRIDTKHTKDGLLVKRPFVEMDKVITKDYEITVSLGTSEQFGSSPPSYSIEGNAIYVTVQKKHGNIEDIREIAKVYARLSNYLCIICERYVDIKKIEVSRNNDPSDRAEVVVPILFEDQIVDKKASIFTLVTVEGFSALIGSTLGSFLDNYEQIAGIAYNLTSYIKGKTGTIYPDMHLALLLQAVDMTATTYYDKQLLENEDLKAKKAEYKSFIGASKDILKNYSATLKGFIKSASKHYVQSSLGDKIQLLAKDYQPIVRTNLTNIDNAKAVSEIRNDIMHGRGVNYEKSGKILVSHSGIEKDLESLVICYLLKESGVTDELLKVIGDKLSKAH